MNVEKESTVSKRVAFGDLTTMEDELASIIGRKVDLVEKESLRNPFRRQHILGGRKVLYGGTER